MRPCFRKEWLQVDWTIWILLSAVFLAFYDLAKKASVRDNAVLPTLLISTFCGGSAFIGATAVFGDVGSMLHPGWRLLALAGMKSLIVATSWILTFSALRTLPITLATPIRASAPAIVFVAAFFCYGEVPSWIQGVGMLFVFGGYWAFSWAGRHEGIDFLRNRAVWCAVGGMCCSACSSMWDKYVFQILQAPVEIMQFWFQIGLFTIYGVLLLGRTALRLRHDPFEWRWTIPCVGILLAFADWLYFKGLAIPDVPISVGSLLRRFSVVITFLLGAKFFHETNLRRKGLALAAILAGVVLLTLRM